MLFSTCITEIFVISTKAPESVIQHCNLMAIYYQSRIFSCRLKHKVPLYSLEAHFMTNAKSTVHQYLVPFENYDNDRLYFSSDVIINGSTLLWTYKPQINVQKRTWSQTLTAYHRDIMAPSFQSLLEQLGLITSNNILWDFPPSVLACFLSFFRIVLHSFFWFTLEWF